MKLECKTKYVRNTAWIFNNRHKDLTEDSDIHRSLDNIVVTSESTL